MLRVFCDFDGTITNLDSIVFLTERFGGGPDFRESILSKIVSGEMTVFEAVEHELATISAEWEEALALLRTEVVVDPFFGEFVEWCRDREIPLAILSSGMRPVVEAFVGRFEVPIFAHSVEISSSGWRYRHEEQNDKWFLLEARGHRRKGHLRLLTFELRFQRTLLSHCAAIHEMAGKMMQSDDAGARGPSCRKFSAHRFGGGPVGFRKHRIIRRKNLL
ncbi:MAG: HAD-IB family phosphatase [Acidobacteriota bacterium]